MPAWPGDERLFGLVSCNKGDEKLACIGAHKKTVEWLVGGQKPAAGLNNTWDLSLEDHAC